MHDFKIGPSKYEGLRLDMQIEYKGEKRVTWTDSSYLMDTIKQVPKPSGFPFKTTIRQEDDGRYIFD